MIEQLERRRLLTAAVPELVDGVLTIVGTAEADRIELSESLRVGMPTTTIDASGTTVERFIRVRVNGLEPSLFKLDDVRSILILAADGNDRITTHSIGRGIHAEGGAGDDTIIGTDHADTLVGGLGDDRLRARAGIDLLDAGLGRDVLSGGTGRDTADYSKRTDDLAITLDGEPNDGAGQDELDNVLPNVENILGGSGNDRLVASHRHNILKGNAGDDTLRGLAGNDILVGGAGADLINAGGGNDGVFISDADGDTASGGNGIDGILKDDADTISDFERLTDMVKKWIFE